MTNCIEISGLCKDYGAFQLRDVSLTLPGGTILGLIGENGAGKTTTLKAILGLIHRDRGSIRLLGEDVDTAGSVLRQDIGVVLDECFFHDALSPRDVERILAPIYHRWDRDAYRTYLEKFRLPPRQAIQEFSRGMKMKLSLAAALSHHPRLLILDEATAGLDPVVRDEILDEFLAFVCDEEHGILVSSHITSDLEKVADYIAYLHQGQVVLAGGKDDLLERYGRLACSAAELGQVDPTDLVRVRRGSFGCQALVADRAAFARKYPGLLVERATLEEIMLLIGKGERP